MQNPPLTTESRLLWLSPAGLAAAFAALAFIRGLFAWLFVALVHPRFHPMGPMPMHMYHHGTGAHLVLWLGSVVVAAIAGAVLAWVYNAVAARTNRPGPDRAAGATPAA